MNAYATLLMSPSLSSFNLCGGDKFSDTSKATIRSFAQACADAIGDGATCEVGTVDGKNFHPVVIIGDEKHEPITDFTGIVNLIRHADGELVPCKRAWKN